MKIYHEPVLLKESIDGLCLNPNGAYVDVTYGGGGHSREILKRLNNGKLLAFDQDLEAEQNILDDARLIFVRQNFRFLKSNLKYQKIDKVDGIIADLGVSSYQFNQSERGFSFRFDGKLDMRMNTDSKLNAGKILNSYSGQQLYEIFSSYGEVNNSTRLAALIVKDREGKLITDIKQFIEIISSCIPGHKKNQYLAKVFQALRIEVNREIECLKELLIQSVETIKKKGRLVIISYHSLEDRLVKNFIKTGTFTGRLERDIYGNFSVPFTAINKKVLVPGLEEISRNNRARSAKLRIAEKT